MPTNVKFVRKIEDAHEFDLDALRDIKEQIFPFGMRGLYFKLPNARTATSALARLTALAGAGTSALFLMVATADAATIVDKKLAQFGIEPRLTCGKWVKPWHGAKICIGTGRTEFLQHDFHLVVDGPEPEAAVRQVLEEATAAAAAAALGTGIATPTLDPASRIGAALAAAKATFVGYLAARGFERLISQYDIRVTHDTFWS